MTMPATRGGGSERNGQVNGAALPAFLRAASLLWLAASALFLAAGNFGLSASFIAELVSQRGNVDAVTSSSLARQWAFTWVGVAFLMLGIVGQLIPATSSANRSNLAANARACVLGFIAGVALPLLGLWVAQQLASSHLAAVKRLIHG